MTTKYELKPVHDGAISFYKKAYVEVSDIGELKLFSYETHVLTIDKYGKLLFEDNYLDSRTTRRHINEFLIQNGYGTMTKNEMNIYRSRQYAIDCE